MKQLTLIQLILRFFAPLRYVKASSWFTIFFVIPVIIFTYVSAYYVIVDPTFGARVTLAAYMITMPLMIITALAIVEKER
jgi:hypothetical protein